MPALPRTRLIAAAALTLLATGSAQAAQPLGVAEAVNSGRALAVRDMGGAPQDVIAALKVDTRTRHPGGKANVAKTLAELDHFADTSDGATFAYIPSDDPPSETKAPKT